MSSHLLFAEKGGIYLDYNPSRIYDNEHDAVALID